MMLSHSFRFRPGLLAGAFLLLGASLHGAITNNLAGHWTLDETDSENLEVINSAPVTDPEHGVRTATMQIGRSSPVGTGYLFDGAANNDYVDLGTALVEQLRASNSLSISGWINPTFLRAGTGAGSRQTIFAANTHLQFSLQNEGKFAYIYRREGAIVNNIFTAAPSIEPGKLIHVALTHANDPDGFGDDVLSLYVDGVLYAETYPMPSLPNFEIEGTEAEPTPPVHFGRYQGNLNTARDFDGFMSDFGLWIGRALTQREVAAIGGLGRAGFALASSEVDSLIGIHNSGSGTVTTGDWVWTYTTGFAEPTDGSTLALGKHYYGTDDNIYVILGGSSGFWTGVKAEGGVPYGAPITVQTQPEDLLLELGETGNFEIGVQSDDPVEYQWYFRPTGSSSFTPVGGNSSTLTIENVGLENRGTYYCVVSQVSGEFSVTSHEARLAISNPPAELIGHWRLNETDPGSLDVVNHAPGGFEPAIRTATMQLAQPAPTGLGYFFDGAGNNDVITSGHWLPEILNTTNQMSYSVWIKPEFIRSGTGANSRQALIGIGDLDFVIVLANEGQVWYRMAFAGGQETSATTSAAVPVQAGEFAHVVVTRSLVGEEETAVSVYLDGVPVHSASGLSGANFSIGSAAAQLGRRGTRVDRDFDGVMADVGLWAAQALTPAEVSLIGGLGRAGHSLASTDEIAALQDLFASAGGTVTTGAWEWSYTTEFASPEGGAALQLGRHYLGEDGKIYVVLGGEEDAWSGLVAEGGEVGGYQAWVQASFDPADWSNPAVTGPLADPAGDGVTNLLKYAFGLSPLEPAPREELPWAAWEAGELILEFTRVKDISDVTYVVEFSTDLIDWDEAPETILEDSVDDRGETERVTFKVGAADGLDRGFLRVRVEWSNAGD